MASLGVLGSLMSQLGAMEMPQYSPLDVARQQNLVQGGRLSNQTALVQLDDMRRTQEAEALVRQRIQQDPRVAALLFGGGGGQPVLSTLGGASGAPGAITQSPMAGMPGQPQTVPGYPDLSQFATGQVPPPTLATLGGPQAQANPLLEMARQNPQAALLLQRQMQGQEDAQLTRQANRLTMGEKVLDYLGRSVQGVTSQADLDTLRRQLEQQGLGQYAVQLPQVYSAEAMQSIVDRALSVKERLTLEQEDLKAQAAMMKARREQANIPNYTGDAQLDALIYTEMKDQPPGTMPSQDIVDRMITKREAAKLKVSREQGLAAAEVERTAKPLEGEAAKAVSDLGTLRQLSEDVGGLHKDDYTGPVVGRTGYLREQAGRMDTQEVAFRRTIADMSDILARLRSGAAIPPSDMRRLEGLVPSVNDLPEVFRSKLQSFQRAIEQQRESRLRTATTGREELRRETTPTTPLPAGQAPPSGGQTSQAPPSGKVVSRAALHEEARRRNISPAQAEQLAIAKGYRVQ